MKRGKVVWVVIGTLAALGGLFWWLLQGVTLHVLEPTGAVAAQQRDLIWLTIGLSAIVVIPVFVLLISFATRYSEKSKATTYTPDWHSNNIMEIIWWGIPIVIIGILGTVTWFTSHSLDPYKPLASNQKPVEVQVVALQWKWLFIYPDEKVAVLNELPIVKDRPVHFTISADAPMSAFWIPTLGTQIYSMNGMNSQLNLVGNKLGDFYGYNTNINGEGYASMRFAVKVRTQDEYDSIMRQARKSVAALDEVAYQSLAQPSTDAKPYYYRLVDSGLYQQIVMKYMHGSLPAPTDTSAPMEHTMHGMEGM